MKFDYGDEVVFRHADPNNDLAGKAGSVVGITPIETEDQVRVFGYPLGTVLYTIEFGDGSDRLVPEATLETASEP